MKENKYVLITGANGFLGNKLVKSLISENYEIIAVVSDDQKKHNLLTETGHGIECITSGELFKKEYDASLVDVVVHLAFSRIDRSEREIASSIDYSQKLFEKVRSSGISNVINISSQAVYGNIKEFRKEDMSVAPTNIYGMAKYAVEVLTHIILGGVCNYTSLRLDNVIESQNLVKSLCKQARDTSLIELIGGKQVFSYISADDAVNAIISMIQVDGKWKTVYNVGHNRERYSLVEIAEKVKNIAYKIDHKMVDILLEEDERELWSGMDTSEFSRRTGWKYVDDIDRMIGKIYINEII